MSDNRAVLREFIERVWNCGELEAVAELVAPAYTIYSDPGDPWHGQTLDRSAFVHRLVESKAPFPDLKFNLGEMVAEGDRVAVSWVLTGTHTADLGALRASGNAIRVEGMTIYTFEGGMLTGHRQVVDRLAVLQQLGALAG